MSLKTELALSSNSELRTLLENVSDAYPDFILGVMLTFANDKSGQNKMISFLKANPDATADEISEYEDFLYFGY